MLGNAFDQGSYKSLSENWNTPCKNPISRLKTTDEEMLDNRIYCHNERQEQIQYINWKHEECIKWVEMSIKYIERCSYKLNEWNPEGEIHAFNKYFNINASSLPELLIAIKKEYEYHKLNNYPISPFIVEKEISKEPNHKKPESKSWEDSKVDIDKENRKSSNAPSMFEFLFFGVGGFFVSIFLILWFLGVDIEDAIILSIAGPVLIFLLYKFDFFKPSKAKDYWEEKEASKNRGCTYIFIALLGALLLAFC